MHVTPKFENGLGCMVRYTPNHCAEGLTALCEM